jgi:hypothetical protein
MNGLTILPSRFMKGLISLEVKLTKLLVHEGSLRNLRSRGSGSQPAVTMSYSRSRVENQVGEDEEEDATPQVELEDY